MKSKPLQIFYDFAEKGAERGGGRCLCWWRSSDCSVSSPLYNIPVIPERRLPYAVRRRVHADAASDALSLCLCLSLCSMFIFACQLFCFALC